MDERLEAGRYHLNNGDRALHAGRLVEGRTHFEAALLQFRGPELRLGEAHAMRGLAAVQLGLGDLASAHGGLQQAVDAYRDVLHQLKHFDHEGVSFETERDAREGEAAAMVLLGDVLLRSGRTEEARHHLTHARDLFQGLGDVPAASGVFTALGRLALREGRLGDAKDDLARAIALLTDAGDVAGEAAARLLRAEADRLEGALGVAADELTRAARLAEKAADAGLLGRARSALGSLLAQRGRLQDAEGSYEEALSALRAAGDLPAEAFALLGRGDVRSRRQDLNAILDLEEGTRLMAQIEHRHGLGLAMLRIAAHLLRLGLPAYALACSESARQLWLDVDPVRGVGQALRLQVKALADLRQWAAMVTVAEARAAVASEAQPNAAEVRAFFRARAVGHDDQETYFAELDQLSESEVELKAEAMVQRLLEPMVAGLDLEVHGLGLAGGAVALLQAVVAATPLPAPSRTGIPELPDDAIESLPPEEEEHLRAAGDYAGVYDGSLLVESPLDEDFVVEDDDGEPSVGMEADAEAAHVSGAPGPDGAVEPTGGRPAGPSDEAVADADASSTEEPEAR